MTKFDSNLAWREASTAVSVNRDVVLVLAGVFFMLPSLALELIFPQPEQQAGMAEAEVMAMVKDYYLSILPVMIPLALFQLLGTLSLLTLLTDRSRPTVGEAIKAGAGGLIPYFLAQLILGLGLGLFGTLVLGVSGLTGVAALVAIGAAIVIALAVFLFIRTSLAGPVIAIEGERNPVEALKRSWRLVEGNTARIGVFVLLVFVAFMIVLIIASALIGIVFALLAGPEATRIAGAVVAALISAVMALYFVAIWAAIHRQLAGPGDRVITETFE